MKNFLRVLADPLLIIGTAFGIAVSSIPFWILAQRNIWFASLSWLFMFFVFEVAMIVSYKNL